MNKFNPPTELPLLLGRKLEAPKPAPVTVVELKPFLFLDKLTGRMSYSPPTPPENKPAPAPIKPVARPDGLIVWHAERPPEVGWYVATRSAARPLNRARYWNGARWSWYVQTSQVLARTAKVPAITNDYDDFVWAYRLEI